MPSRYRSSLTAEEARAALDYDPNTGEFWWKHRADRAPRWNTRRAGVLAGSLQRRYKNDKSDVVIRVNDTLYLAQRLAWLYVHGEWPDRDIDHIDRDSLNNRIANLRLCVAAENALNRVAQSNSKSGVKGVSPHGPSWRARIKADGVNHVCVFPTIEAATHWRKAMEDKYHGKFAPQEPTP